MPNTQPNSRFDDFKTAMSQATVNSNIIAESGNPTTDSFGRIKTCNPQALFQSQLQYDSHPIFWNNDTAGSGTITHDPDSSSVNLSVTANTGDYARRQTREYMRYQPGKSHTINMTGTFGVASSGVTKRLGYFDSDNGIFFEQDEDGFYVVLRSKVTGSVVETRVAQDDWNTDKLDGTGDSGLTFDVTKSQIFFINLQWLGVGLVEIGFVRNGKIVLVHKFLNNNVQESSYMTTANLPVRYEILSDGTGSGSLRQICCIVESEGGNSLETLVKNIMFSASTKNSPKTVTTSRTPILSIRPKQTFNGITNRSITIPRSMDVFTEDKSCRFEMIYGGTLTSASFSGVNASSAMEFDTSATAISGGISMDNIYTDKKGSIALEQLVRYPITLDSSGNHPTSPYTDCLTVVGTNLGAGNTNCYASVKWNELR